MEQKHRKLIWCFLVLCIFITGCSFSFNKSKNEKLDSQVSTEDIGRSIDTLHEDKRIYDNKQKGSVTNLYVTVVDEHHRFYDLTHWFHQHDINSNEPKLDVIVQEGSENGPEKGYWEFGQEIANASIELRGASTRTAVQKSFKIKLFDNAGSWNGQTTLNLNKHIYDFTRVRNKLSFDLFKTIPNFTSLRTQFIHLHVKDLTSDSPSTNWEDYGLFTHIEQTNEKFLASRGLEPNGQLYKAKEFEFHRYPEQLTLSDDPNYNKKQFESILEIKGSKDHSKLIRTLDEVNDLSMDINQVIDKRFDRENYLTWLAVNIIMGNWDTTTQNYYLYSPLNSEKFFFLPWDYDGALGYEKQKDMEFVYSGKWQRGLSNYWGSVLHQRFIKDPNNVQQLSEKIEELSNYINSEQTKALLDIYYPVVNKFVQAYPDNQYLPDRLDNYDTVYNQLIHVPEENIKLYHNSLENPMPVYLGDVQLVEDSYEFMWDRSYDLQGDNLTYDFQISKTIDFSSIYFEKNNLTTTFQKVLIDELEAGENYWRVIIRDSKGNTQEAFDRINAENGIYYDGLKEFIVN